MPVLTIQSSFAIQLVFTNTAVLYSQASTLLVYAPVLLKSALTCEYSMPGTMSRLSSVTVCVPSMVCLVLSYVSVSEPFSYVLSYALYPYARLELPCV